VFVRNINFLGFYSDPSPGFRSRGDKKTQGEPHFLNTMLDVCSNRGAKYEMGTHILNGGMVPLAPDWGRQQLAAGLSLKYASCRGG